MDWVILFIVNWLLLIIMVDLKTLKKNIGGGLLAVAMQLFVDTQFIKHELYVIHNPVLSLWGSSLFFIFGPVFTIGILFAQFHPVKRWAIIVHLLFLSMVFSAAEYLLVLRHSLEYIRWNQVDSVGVNVAAMGLLSWFCIVVLKKTKGEIR